MKFYKLFFSLIFLALFNCCKNDLKLNAPYKEIPSIYAVLNPQETTQTIRINKVFLGEGDANVMAKVADSVNYKAGELTVMLDGVDVNGTSQSITFTEDVIEADPGAFSTTQRVYVTNTALFGSNLHPSKGTYTLTVKNNITGNVFKAAATTLDSIPPAGGFSPWAPYGNYYGDPLNPPLIGNKTVFIDYDTEPPNKGPFSIKIAPTDGIKYQLTIRMHYYDSLLSSTREYHYVDYAFTNQNKKDAVIIGNQGPFLNSSFYRGDLLNKVASELGKSSTPATNIVGRRMYRIDFICYKVSQDYVDFLDYNSPSFSIAQTKPLYSNFQNKAALGLFTFRSRYHVMRDISSNFKDMFAASSVTCKFKFLNSANSLPFCP